jgi:transcriptional regulator with XRE-family HTH domain
MSVVGKDNPQSKKARLEVTGWRLGSAQEFLGLSDEESAYVELRLRLAESLRVRRQKRKASQTDLAKMLGSSQSRVAKMEGGDPSVSIDLMVRSLLALGASNRDLARAISGASRTPSRDSLIRRWRQSARRSALGGTLLRKTWRGPWQTDSFCPIETHGCRAMPLVLWRQRDRFDLDRPSLRRRRGERPTWASSSSWPAGGVNQPWSGRSTSPGPKADEGSPILR